MTKHLFSFLLLCILQQNSYAQNKDIDARAASIPDVNCANVDAMVSYIKENFTTEEDRIRAVYVWVTNHISYDVPQLHARKDNPGGPPQAVADVLNTRHAVCQGYSDLFTTVCQGLGINAIAIPGYTKLQGKIAPLSHAWVAASLNGEWYFFDPTWGAGHVRDEQFIKRFNNAFYKVSPVNFIADHIPFDPMYQFLSNPVSHKQFIYGTPGNKVLFNYNDSLKQYNQLSSIQQNAVELRRLEAAGIENDLLRERQEYLKNRLQSFTSKNSFDEGGKLYINVLASYKEYIAHKNKMFSTIGDNDLRQMVDSMVQNVKLARSLISSVVSKTEAQSQAKINTLDNMDRFWIQLDKEKQFVKQYCTTDKEARRQLFMKR